MTAYHLVLCVSLGAVGDVHSFLGEKRSKAHFFQEKLAVSRILCYLCKRISADQRSGAIEWKLPMN